MKTYCYRGGQSAVVEFSKPIDRAKFNLKSILRRIMPPYFGLGNTMGEHLTIKRANLDTGFLFLYTFEHNYHDGRERELHESATCLLDGIVVIPITFIERGYRPETAVRKISFRESTKEDNELANNLAIKLSQEIAKLKYKDVREY